MLAHESGLLPFFCRTASTSWRKLLSTHLLNRIFIVIVTPNSRNCPMLIFIDTGYSRGLRQTDPARRPNFYPACVDRSIPFALIGNHTPNNCPPTKEIVC